MGIEKSIVVGCNDMITLPAMLQSLNVIDGYNFISATRISDVISIAKSLRPVLLILHFRNNQMALNAIEQFLKEPNLPIVCLIKKKENKTLSWRKQHIVFTIPLEYAFINSYLSTRISSVLMLMKNANHKRKRKSFTADNLMHQNKNLSRYVLELDQKRATLTRIKEELKILYAHVDDRTRMRLMSMANDIKGSVSDKKRWDDFRVYFENVNPDYIRKLSEKHPSLTPKDIKYCCYLKMNMSNDDIRHILGINQESVRTHKYRLKKKMALTKNEDLYHYTRSFHKKSV